MNPSLYVHIPVCLRKCDYCDFFSVPGIAGTKLSAIVRALAAEIAAREKAYAPEGWKTVYIGGGTPSLLSPADIGVLCGSIRPQAVSDGDLLSGGSKRPEWTIEANPEDLTAEWLDACRAGGINRLSLGLQSMDDAVLSAVGRRGSRKANLEALRLVQDVWKGTLSVDLIAGLPGQTRDGLEADIRELLAFSPDHVSLYSLTVEEGTPLAARLAGASPPAVPDDDESAALWLAGRDLLSAAGYLQYEVSNFARSGAESAHNLTYWHLEPYIGVGPGAAGTVNSGDTAERFTDVEDLEIWLENPASSFETEHIDRASCIREFLLMGMRLASGISRKRFKDRFGQDILELTGKTVRRWQERGLAENGEDRGALNADGLLFLNRFLSECMEELC